MQPDPIIRGASPYSLLASLTLLYDPASCYESVGEAIEISRTELTRSVKLRLHIPDEGLGLLGLRRVTGKSRTVKKFFLPLLTPKKHVLVDIRELSVEGQHSFHTATHDEHVELSRAMIRARVASVYLNDKLIPPGHAREYVDAVAKKMDELGRIVGLPDAKAKTELRKLFPDAAKGDYRIAGIPYAEDLQSTSLNRLYLLCKLLATRYLKVIVITGNLRLGDSLTVSYKHREAFRSSKRPIRRKAFETSRIFLRDQMGASPSSIRVPVPWARRTGHYRFRFVAPEGHFFHRARFLVTKEIDGRRRRIPITDRLHSHADDDLAPPSASLELGGGGEAYMLLTSGTNADGYVDAGFTCYEMPPGSTGYAFSTALVLTMVLSLMYLLVTFGKPQWTSNDLPALIVALAASAPILASPFMPRSDLFSTPVMTRLSLLACGLAGNVFALWLVALNVEVPRVNEPIQDFLRVFQSHAGATCCAVVVAASLGLLRRLVGAGSKFNQARVDNYKSAPEHS